MGNEQSRAENDTLSQDDATYPFPAYSFELDDPAWVSHLDTEGFVVVRSVASAEDVSVAMDLIWSDCEGAEGVDRHDPTTWAHTNWRLPRSGLVGSLAQSAGPWYLRGLPKVRTAFSRIWDTDELISSMDAVLIWRPWWGEECEDFPVPVTEGLHLDQNPFDKPQKDCVQGMIPLIEVTEDVGGLEVVPRSHTSEAKERFKQRHPEMKGIGDWCMLRPRDPDGIGHMLVCARAGDLVLWDSRTIHGGVVGRGKPTRASNDNTPLGLARMTCTVAMTPRAWASEEVQQARRDGQAAGESFNHCPHEAGTSSGTIRRRRKKGYHAYELTPTMLEVL